jgi:hypothetical protein
MVAFVMFSDEIFSNNNVVLFVAVAVVGVTLVAGVVMAVAVGSITFVNHKAIVVLVLIIVLLQEEEGGKGAENKQVSVDVIADVHNAVFAYKNNKLLLRLIDDDDVDR